MENKKNTMTIPAEKISELYAQWQSIKNRYLKSMKDAEATETADKEFEFLTGIPAKTIKPQ